MTQIDKTIYNRDELLKKIKLILSNPTKFKITNEIKFLSIVIDGKWGTGKTTFVHQIKETYKAKNCVYFDAWKFDFLNDPFSSLTNLIVNNKKGKVKEHLDKCVQKFKRFLPNVFSIELFSLVKLGFEWNENNKFKEKSCDISKEIENFQDEVNKLLKTPLLIIIDELDRCKPSFAINLIEIVKHLFNMENIIVIFSLNWTQLHDSLHSEYGLPNNKEEFYMDKIVDWNFHLPKLDNEKYLKDLIEKNCKLLKDNDNINNFVNWIIETQKIDTLRDVVKKFSKWYLNWESRVIKTGKENFYLCIEKIIFSFLNDGSVELNYIDIETLVNQSLPWEYPRGLIREINELSKFSIINIESIGNLHISIATQEIINMKKIFGNIKLSILDLENNYDLSIEIFDNIQKIVKKNKIYNHILNWNKEMMVETKHIQHINSWGSTSVDPLECIKKEYLDYFLENIDGFKIIMKEIKLLPKNICLLINNLLKN